MKNNNELTKKLVSTNRTKHQIVYAIGTLAIGIFIGWIVTNSAACNTSATSPEIQNTTQNTIHPSQYNFINPQVQSSSNEKLYNQELTTFENLIEAYCKNAKQDKSIEQISFYFRDFSNGLWIGVNEKEKFIPASLTKVPIMIATFQLAEKDPSYLQKKLLFEGSFTSRYLKAHPEIDDLRTTMEENQYYTVQQLVDLMITKSDNEAAMLLYNDFGQKHWDALQKRLGDQAPIAAPLSENILTVKSYSSFFRILYNASLLNREYSEKALEILSRSEYDKGIRLAVPSNIKVCHKYGERDTAVTPTKVQIQQLHHAGIVYYPGKTYFVCVMTKGSDKAKMQQVIHDLAKIAHQQVEKQVKEFEKPALQSDIN